MTNVTTLPGMRVKRTSLATAPTPSRGASVSRNRPSSRSRRLPSSAWSRMRSSLVSAVTLVVDLDDVVQSVALHGDLPGVADDPEELLARQAGRGFRARHVLHALVLQGAVDVIGPEVERDRRRLLAEEDPVGLDVGKVVEEQAGRGNGAQVVGRRCSAVDEPRRSDLVGERDEGEEASGGVLLLAQAQEMIDALGVGFQVTIEHGGVRADTEPVGDPVDLAPPIGVGLARVLEELGQA